MSPEEAYHTEERVPRFEDFNIIEQINRVKTWQPRRDVWPFTYGLGAVAGGVALSSTYFHHYYRRAMKLGARGRYLGFFPTVLIPTFFSTACHFGMVSSYILSGMMPCWTCLEVRAAASQVLLGVVQPLLLAPAFAYFLASHHFTAVVPSVPQLGGHLLTISNKLLRTKLPGIVLGQLILVSLVTHLEISAVLARPELTVAQKAKKVVVS